MDIKTIIAELERELKMRERVYPGLIRSGKLHPDLARKRNQALLEAITIIRGKEAPKAEQKNLF